MPKMHFVKANYNEVVEDDEIVLAPGIFDDGTEVNVIKFPTDGKLLTLKVRVCNNLRPSDEDIKLGNVVYEGILNQKNYKYLGFSDIENQMTITERGK
jgi:hypothetical protein